MCASWVYTSDLMVRGCAGFPSENYSLFPPPPAVAQKRAMVMAFLSSLPPAAMATPGWPSCVDSCSGHGNCSHIGVCSCERGWRGDACAEAVCAAHCARHGICVAGNAGASCACDAGYVGADCSRRAPPPPPPFGSEMQARQLGEVPPGPPVHHNFTVSSLLDGGHIHILETGGSVGKARCTSYLIYLGDLPLGDR